MNALRMVFLSIAGVVLLGIWLTGFDKAHWVLYVLVVLLALAGLTGVCPGLIFWTRAGFQERAACVRTAPPGPGREVRPLLRLFAERRSALDGLRVSCR